MNDLKVFQTKGGTLGELESSSAPLERGLQTLFEPNLKALLGVRFLASEYVTTHGGRMDTLGIEENSNRRIKNFACVELKTSLDCVRLYLKVDPESVELEDGFTRDVREIGHFGTGDLEVSLRCHDDLERAKPLIRQSYEAS